MKSIQESGINYLHSLKQLDIASTHQLCRNINSMYEKASRDTRDRQDQLEDQQANLEQGMLLTIRRITKTEIHYLGHSSLDAMFVKLIKSIMSAAVILLQKNPIQMKTVTSVTDKENSSTKKTGNG